MALCDEGKQVHMHDIWVTAYPLREKANVLETQRMCRVVLIYDANVPEAGVALKTLDEASVQSCGLFQWLQASRGGLQ